MEFQRILPDTIYWGREILQKEFNNRQVARPPASHFIIIFTEN
jgi:hypothetical protein